MTCSEERGFSSKLSSNKRISCTCLEKVGRIPVYDGVRLDYSSSIKDCNKKSVQNLLEGPKFHRWDRPFRLSPQISVFAAQQDTIREEHVENSTRGC
eukprot:752276-Hanusia_phi.AAC.3